MTIAIARIHTTAQRASVELVTFGAWWLHELRDIWLAAVERFAPARSQHFIIDLAGSVGIVRKSDHNSRETPIEFALGAAGELPDAQRIWPQGAPPGARATVILPQSSVLACQMRLPPVAERDVARAVELQLERELPLPRDRLYVDWKIHPSLADRSRVVEVVIARRSVVDRVRESIRVWGWRPVAVTCNRPDEDAHFNLLPAPSRRLSFERGKRERYLMWSALTLSFAYAVTTAGKWWLERAGVGDALEQARAQMAHVDRQRAKLASDSKPIAQLYALMAQPSAAEALIAISAALPHDTWIYHADIRAAVDGVSLRLEGYTPAATSLLQGLEQSSELEAVELVEATSAGVDAGSERIELKARMRGRPST